MTENPEFAAEEPREGSSAPGLEGEGGQYVDGDYGDAGAVNEAERGSADGEYEEGDYGAAGAARAGSLEEGQYADGNYGKAGSLNEPAPGPADDEYEEGDYGDAGTAGGARTEGAIREGLTGGGQMQATTEERGPLHGDRDAER